MVDDRSKLAILDDVVKEFQVERLILHSDAVFVGVIYWWRKKYMWPKWK